MDSQYKRVLSPSLALLNIASLTPHHYRVYIEDENTREIDFDDSPDLVGITVNIDTANRAFNIAEKYRSRNIPVIMGGIYPSSCPDEVLKHCNSVCIGEAEEIWEGILADAAKGELKPSYYNPNPTDMKRYPELDWKLLNKADYLYTNIISASRGCCFKCDFCYNSSNYVHKNHRNRPLDSVIREIESLGTRQVMFIDDNFIGNINWTWSFLKAIKNMKLTWHCAVSSNIGNHLDLLDEMAHCGCRSLFIGFESVNTSSLSSVGKHQNRVAEFEQTIREIHSRDIMINASMVFGFDHDRSGVFEETLQWLVQNRIETMTAHILTPYPGTRLYARLFEENRIIDFNTDNYNTSRTVFRPKQMTPEELTEGYLWIYDEFYNFRNILKRMPESRNRRVAYLLFNLGYRKFGKLTSRLGRAGMMHKIGKLATHLSYGI